MKEELKVWGTFEIVIVGNEIEKSERTRRIDGQC